MGLWDELVDLWNTIQPGAGKTCDMDEEGVTTVFSDGRVEAVRWDDLAGVSIMTTADGPFAEDFFWVLMAEDGSGCIVEGEAAQAMGLLDRLQQLEDFDNEAVIQASCSVEEATFPCWRKKAA